MCTPEKDHYVGFCTDDIFTPMRYFNLHFSGWSLYSIRLFPSHFFVLKRACSAKRPAFLQKNIPDFNHREIILEIMNGWDAVIPFPIINPTGLMY